METRILKKLNEFLSAINEKIKYTSVSGQFPHKHKYKIDKDGAGITTMVNGDGPEHQHQIESFVVQPAGDDNHNHIIEENNNGPKEAY